MAVDTSKGFVAELKRRNVFRVAIAYLAVAWLLIQVAETILPVYGFGDAAVRTVITLFVVLFIPVLVLAWFFELTPEGIVADSAADHTSARAVSMGRKFDFAIIGVLSVALLYFVSMHDWDAAEITGTTGPPDKSVAVLPFANMSALPENEYFSDGLTETLLHALAQIPEMKVPARTSSFFFKGQDSDIREIAEALDVGNVLEGSVQRHGNTVRITAQLIEAETGYHLWSETYDRQMDDIFAVQDEIAIEVAQALQVTLLGVGGKVIEISGTDSVDAYEAYLKGVEQLRTISKQHTQNATDFFKEALANDPDFTDARVKLANTYLQQIAMGNIRREDGVALATEHVELVLASDPDHKPAQFLQLRIQGGGADIDYEIALIEEILREYPDQVDYYYLAFFRYRHFGRIAEGLEWLDRGIAADPLSAKLHNARGLHMLSINRYKEAEASLLRSIELNPADPTSYLYTSDLYWEMQDYVKWFATLHTAMGVDTTDSEIPANIALYLYTFGLPDEAAGYLNRARSIGPNELYFRAAKLYSMVLSGEFDAARTLSETLVREDKDERHGARSFAAAVHTWLMYDIGMLDNAVETMEEVFPGISSANYEPGTSAELGAHFSVISALYMSGESDLTIDDVEAAASAIEARYASWEGLSGMWAQVRYLAGETQESASLALEDLDGRQGWLQTWDWPLRYRHIEPFKRLAKEPAVAARLSEIEAAARQAGTDIREYIEANKLQL